MQCSAMLCNIYSIYIDNLCCVYDPLFCSVAYVSVMLCNAMQCNAMQCNAMALHR